MTTSFGPLSAFLPSLPLDFADAVRQATQLGFTHVDVVGLVERPIAHLEVLAETGVLVQCAVLGRELPANHGLDVADAAIRRKSLDLVKQQLADAARLGANSISIVPGANASAMALAYFAEVCTTLADYAAQRMLHLCVEPVPGSALPTVAATLAWLETVTHPNLYLLLDIERCLLNGEKPGECARRAGSRLGYVHLPDNQGQLMAPSMEAFAASLQPINYHGGAGLMLNPHAGGGLAGLLASKESAERVLRRSQSAET
jgi:sugar phosphate isomerase/epimerase